jgi:hypothetical protein
LYAIFQFFSFNCKTRGIPGETWDGDDHLRRICRLLDESEGLGVGVELEWSKPSNPHGELLGFKLRYGARQDDHQEGGQPLLYTEVDVAGPHTLQHRVQGLGECPLCVCFSFSQSGLILLRTLTPSLFMAFLRRPLTTAPGLCNFKEQAQFKQISTRVADSHVKFALSGLMDYLWL